jgi:hypothetical protein
MSQEQQAEQASQFIAHCRTLRLRSGWTKKSDWESIDRIGENIKFGLFRFDADQKMLRTTKGRHRICSGWDPRSVFSELR